MINSSKQRKSKIPSALLWGCSSGKLTRQGIHDPAGSALNYLLGGAQFVVGNLWDVTDRDIDKYSIDCMQQVFPRDPSSLESTIGGGVSIGKGISNSRNVCKLQYIVGCAPVMYGLPAHITS